MVFEELAFEVMAELPTALARREVLALIEQVREAFGACTWVQYMPHAGAVEVREIGWCG
ncbi:hypothetical protein [Streptomyces sp. NPDC059743]|uniref:hypothetical protein n=1 Tax=Streptomyces sp. NPDC059743 TaxID=3346928 RepID=UPI003651C1C4